MSVAPPDPVNSLSFGGKAWRMREVDDRLALGMAQRLDLPDIVCRVLVGRGIALDDVEDFLNPSLKTALPDPSHLKDMDIAVDRLVAALKAKQNIWVFGDYDVDGGTSAAILVRYFRALGHEISVYIPDRQAEGYGPNGPALQKIRERGGDLAIAVDCGTLSFDAFDVAADVGLDCVVLDHHAAEPNLPNVLALVNPNRLDDDSPHKHMAACAVTFLVCVAMNRTLRADGFFAGLAEPNLLQLLDLVALGTVCDVAPLTGVNRALVTQGLKVLGSRGNIGLAALSDVAGLDEQPGAYHAGFVLGPRINAGGRVGKSDLGARLLSTNDTNTARQLAEQLDGFNTERQDIERQVLDQALDQAETLIKASEQGGVIVVGAEGWHPGVVGIVASRLKDRFNRPACVVALDGPQGTGSGRSIPGVNLGAAVIAAHQTGLLLKGGGHAMAAGFSLDSRGLNDFRDFLNERLGDAIVEAGRHPVLTLDGSLQPGGVTIDLVDTLARIGPFGVGNPEPRFALNGVRIGYADRIGKDGSHLKLSIVGEAGDKVAGIAFRAFEGDMGAALLNHAGRAFDIAGRARLNTWQGRTSVQFQVEDARPA